MKANERRQVVRAALCALVVASPVTACAAETPPVEERSLHTAPVSAQVDGALLRLDAYAWRDFQPISPPGGRPLRVRVRVQAQPGAGVPHGVHIDALWVLQGQQSWPLEVEPAPPLGTVEVLGAHGPKLDPGSTVAIVARLRSDAGDVHWLRAPNVTVRRTD